MDAGLVDRVTLLTYERFENKETEPTLVDWFRILKEQTDEGAKELANKVETYCGFTRYLLRTKRIST